jgi:hypothetical protein
LAYTGEPVGTVPNFTPKYYERFIGSESIDFDSTLEANQEVLKRLKQAEDE